MRLPSHKLLIGSALGVAIVIAASVLIYQKTSAYQIAIPVADTTTEALPIAPPKVTIPEEPLDEKSAKILELFNPSDFALTKQLTETSVSQQIEQILTTSFVLSACKLINSNDYRDSFRAVIVYAQKVKLANSLESAEAKVRQIGESAGASYSLVYSRTKCDDPRLPPIAAQLLNWQKAYLTDQ